MRLAMILVVPFVTQTAAASQPISVWITVGGAFVTIIGAVIVFVLTQYLLKLVLEPVTRLRRILADVSSATLFHQAAITNATANPEIAIELKRLSANLRAAVYEVRFYEYVWRYCGVPPAAEVLRGCHQLNLLSHHMRTEGQHGRPVHMWAEANTESLDTLAKCLRIKTSYSTDE